MSAPATPVPVPAELAEVAERVEARLAAFLAAERAHWRSVDADLDAPLAALESVVLVGGKRLRPAFCRWGWVAAGGDPDDPAQQVSVDDLGAAFELLHAFALVHDDVMDAADTRRGVPTTHVAFAQRHAAGGWRGETRRFGESVAILVGDLAHTYAGEMLEAAPLATRHLFRRMQAELVAGQYLDVLRTVDGVADERQARLIARLKSGRYTIEQPLCLGASLVAGADPAVDAALRAYGAPLGSAFQFRDDVLGAVGDPRQTGKPVGDDLREGKPTLLLALARQRADADQAALLARVGAADLDDDEVVAIGGVIEATGALAALEGEIERLTAEAVAALASADVLSPAARRPLVDLAHFVSARRH